MNVMKVLIVNKFLFPNGGSETYIFELGKQLVGMGHQVQYFGMDHPDRIVGNEANAYTDNMDFHGNSIVKKLIAPFSIIYSFNARKQIRKVLDDFKPDIIHLNNINYQITPSIIHEIRKWNPGTKIVATIHDPQWVCPNHMMINGCSHKGCTKCFEGNYFPCIQGRCIHDSLLRSILGAFEAWLYRRIHIYKQVDTIICPSYFMEETMNNNPDLQGRVVMLRNFLDIAIPSSEDIAEFKNGIGLSANDRYALYFGRYSSEKGIKTVLKMVENLPHIQFVFAGNGPFNDMVNNLPNAFNVGFISGKNLYSMIAGSEFSLIASECYENCPFSVMESQMLGVPSIGADIGGIPELILPKNGQECGILFESANSDDLADKVETLWGDSDLRDILSGHCLSRTYDSIEEYARKIIDIYNS